MSKPIKIITVVFTVSLFSFSSVTIVFLCFFPQISLLAHLKREAP